MLDMFIEETTEYIKKTEYALLVLSKEFIQAVFDDVFRYVHNIKGMAGMLKLEQITLLSHKMEDVLLEKNFPLFRQYLHELKMQVRDLEPVKDDNDVFVNLYNMAQKLNVRLTILKQGSVIEKQIIQKLWQPLIHLFNNATFHGMAKEIILEIARKDNDIIIQLKDDGIGIREEFLKKVFDLGFTTSNSINTSAGRGVGLSSVKHDIEVLGGAISVESFENKGTIFIINLPLHVVERTM